MKSNRTYIEQVQRLSVSPKLVNNVKILQLNAVQLNDYIEEQIQCNPILEYECKPLGYTSSACDKIACINSIPDDTSVSLEDYLLVQLNSLKLCAGQNTAIETLISYLNSDGYLSLDLESIAEESGCSLASLKKGLTVLQSMDPPGIGARSLAECLELQLRSMDRFNSIVKELIYSHLENIADGNLDTISQSLNISSAELTELISLIQSLNPFPGSEFQKEAIEYIIPDVLFSIDEDGAHLALNDSLIPTLKINTYYQSLCKDKTLSSNDADYIQSNLTAAKNLMQAIQYRNRTILSVVNVIVSRQNDFFIHGHRHLHPLTYSEVSSELGIHHSTVGRSIRGKYIETPMGTFPLKFFFPSSVSGNCSSTTIKVLILDIIRNEDSLQPYSDQKIADKLIEQGYSVSRRTVTKYRESLNIASSSKRKTVISK